MFVRGGITEVMRSAFNTSNADLRYLVVSTMEYPDLFEYPIRTRSVLTRPARRRAASERCIEKDTHLEYMRVRTGAKIEKSMKRAGGSFS
jgi:uncharacterized cupin superfamily protein